MSGFIDPSDPLRERIERLEILVSELLRRVPEHDLSSMALLCRASLEVDATYAVRLREHRLLRSLGIDTAPPAEEDR